MVERVWTPPLTIAGHEIRMLVQVTRHAGAQSFVGWVQPLKVEITGPDGTRTEAL